MEQYDLKPWEQDTWDTNINVMDVAYNVPCGMYYYLVPQDQINNMSGIIGNCNAIHSCWLSPILGPNDFDLRQIPYDVDRFGKAVGSLDSTPDVYRIISINTGEKKLGTFNKYNISRPSHNKRDWRNESRLYDFPYRYGMITDYMNTPVDFRYHDIFPYGVDRTFDIIANAMVTDKGSYSIGVKGYKGDAIGVMESLISTAPTEIPVASSAYSTWSSTQKAQTNQSLLSNLQSLSQANAFSQESFGLQRSQAGINSVIGGISSLAGAGLSAATGNLGGAAMGLGGMASNFVGYGQQMQTLNMKSDHANRGYDLAQKQAIGGKDAMVKDLQNTPRSMMCTGSDVLFALKRGKRSIDLYRYGITDQYATRLGDYFAMYGYKQAKTMRINLNSRIYYNYIKTVGANIVSSGVGKRIPKDHLRKLTEIFDNGVTIWHIDRNGGIFQNYEYDNQEVQL